MRWVANAVQLEPSKWSVCPASPTTHTSVGVTPEIAYAIGNAIGSGVQPNRAHCENDAPHELLQLSGPASNPLSTHVPSGGAPSHSSGPLTMPSPQRPTH